MKEEVIELNVKDIKEFPNHPFKINDDLNYEELRNSIIESGVLVPTIVRKSDDEKYGYSPNNTAYYYVIFQNGRTFSHDGFSVLELNNIRNILYNISIHKEEIGVDDINNKKQMVYKSKMRLQQTGFTSVVTLLLGVSFFDDILVIALWIFKLITK